MHEKLKESAKDYLKVILNKTHAEEQEALDGLVNVLFLYIEEVIKDHERKNHEYKT